MHVASYDYIYIIVLYGASVLPINNLVTFKCLPHKIAAILSKL